MGFHGGPVSHPAASGSASSLSPCAQKRFLPHGAPFGLSLSDARSDPRISFTSVCRLGAHTKRWFEKWTGAKQARNGRGAQKGVAEEGESPYGAWRIPTHCRTCCTSVYSPHRLARHITREPIAHCIQRQRKEWGQKEAAAAPVRGMCRRWWRTCLHATHSASARSALPQTLHALTLWYVHHTAGQKPGGRSMLRGAGRVCVSYGVQGDGARNAELFPSRAACALIARDRTWCGASACERATLPHFCARRQGEPQHHDQTGVAAHVHGIATHAR